MRLSVSHRFFLLYLIFALITLIMGVTVYFSINQLEKNSYQINQLYDFEVQVKKLEIYNINQTFHVQRLDLNELNQALDRAEDLVDNIIKYELAVAPGKKVLPGKELQINLHNYRKAANELIAHNDVAINLQTDLMETLHSSITRLSSLAGQEYGDILFAFSSLEHFKDEFERYQDLAVFLTIRQAVKKLKTITTDPELLKIADTFILNMEKLHFNNLAIENRLNFLIKTNKHFSETARETIAVLAREGEKEQAQLRHRIALLIVLSVVLAIILWRYTSNRLAIFFTNMNTSIQSIKAGDYDYKMKQGADDEFGDLVKFLKEMSFSLKKEIAEREASEAEKIKLQKQLFQAQRLESIGLLAGGVAHDFNNILTSIIGYAELAMIKGKEGNHVDKYVKTILDAGHRAENLTRQLLAFSRKQKMEVKITNLNMIIDNLKKLLERLIGEKIEFEIILDGKLGNIKADPSLIEQIVMNLVVNARDAMPSGGHLVLATSAVSIDDQKDFANGNAKAGKYSLLSVTDNGVGMSTEIKERIFDPFFTTKEVGKGTGLGLSMAYGIIEQHEGFLEVESEKGKGSKFLLYFPEVEGIAFADKESALIERRKGTECILVVDDEPAISNFVEDCLWIYGYTVIKAGSAEEALQIFKEKSEEIDVLLTDVVMPGMDGIDLVKQINKKRPEIKTILMSGYTSQEVNGKTLGRGDFVYLQKPMTSESLMQKLAEVLDGKS